jgi:hydrogenase maturation protease
MSDLLVLGLGNDILSDDAAGLLVVRQLAVEYAGDSRMAIRETQEMGLALLDYFSGCREAILVDSIQTGTVAPGFLHELDAAGLKRLSGGTPHFLGVGETLDLGRQLGLAMPRRVRIFAIEVANAHTVGTCLSPAIQDAFPAILDRLRAALQE